MMTSTETSTETKRTRVTKPLMDWANATAETTDEPITSTANRFGPLDGTPFEQWVQDSFEQTKAKRLTVASQDAAKQAAHLLSLAAEKLGLGLRCPKPYETLPDGQVVVLFQGKARAVRTGPAKPRAAREGESAEDFRARVAEWVKATGKTWEAPKAK